MPHTGLRLQRSRSGHCPGLKVKTHVSALLLNHLREYPNWYETACVNFIKLQKKRWGLIKKETHLQCLIFLDQGQAQGHSQGSIVSLRGLRGHLLHTVTFHVNFNEPVCTVNVFTAFCFSASVFSMLAIFPKNVMKHCTQYWDEHPPHSRWWWWWCW